MNSSKFKENEFKKLCSIIGFKPSVVEPLILNLSDYYTIKIEQKKDKTTGDFKRYSDGTIKERILHPSHGKLKIIQSLIKKRILTPIALPDCVHGGVKKRSNISNAKPHQGKKYKFTTDVQDFFPNISYNMVYTTFLQQKFSPHFSHWLTKLTTWKFNLPQGTPTSTHISNLVMLPLDIKIIEFCNIHNITYTRYIDDLTFSSPVDFRHHLNDILELITTQNLKLNYRKTKYKGNQTITGIEVFLNKIDAPEIILNKASNQPSVINYIKNIRKTNRSGKSKLHNKNI